FLREQLGPGDRMAVFTTSSTQSLEFTSDRDALSKAIALIAPHPRQSATGLTSCPRMTGYDAYLITVLHDQGALLAKNEEAKACSGPLQDSSVREQIALNACGLKCTFGMPPTAGSGGVPVDVPVETIAEANWELARGVSSDTLAAVGDVVGYTARQPGQRIVVLASSGFFSETLDNEKDRIIREALRDGVVINALDAKGLYLDEIEPPLSEQSVMGTLPLAAFIFDEASQFPMRAAQADAMASFAEATGGLYFKDNNDLTVGFQRLGLAPEAGYDLSFTPTPLVRDGKLHTLKYELVPGISGATIEARRGYFAPLPGPTADEIERDLYEAMRGTAVRSALPVEAKVGAGPGGLAVRVHFGVSQANEKLALVAGLFDASGQYLTGERGDVVLALKDASLKKLRRSGLAPVFQLRAAAGKYRLRVVVEDETSGAVAEISQTVQVQ
ncbi:MAG TPA: VWA domain-containing protein, partial [Terriglobales bacterium]|nr:VWA domain-containing protein [Terriglobales bacterium]